MTRRCLVLVLVAGGAAYQGACSRETLVGVGVPPLGSGGIDGGSSGGLRGGGSGGELGPGSGGTFGSGSGGSAGTLCSSSVSLAPGVLNDCGHVHAAAFSPDGALLATAGADILFPNLRVWQVRDGKLLYEVPQATGIMYDVAFSPDGKLLALVGVSPVVSPAASGAAIFTAATGALLTTLPTQSGPYVTALAFSHDGTRLVTGGALSIIDVWKVADWSELLAIPTVGNETIYAVDFSPDDSRLVTSGSARTNRIRKTSDGSVLAEIPDVYPEENRATYSPNGQLILSIGGAGQLQLLDPTATTLQVVTFMPTSNAVYPIGHAAWLDDSRFVADDWGGTVEEWAKDPLQPQGPFVLTNVWNMPSQAWGFAVAPDGRSFVVTGDFGFEVLAP